MMQWLNKLATKPDNLNPIRGTYRVGKKNKKQKTTPTSCPLPASWMLWLPNTEAPYTIRRGEGGSEGRSEGRRKDYLETRQALTCGNCGLTYTCQFHIVISNLLQLHFLSPQSLVY